MKVGTKSILFGCHQFLWHPLTVLLAYRKLFRTWPDFYGCLCIFFHDWGYWGCGDIDGNEGKLHPLLGAQIVGKLVYWFDRWKKIDRFPAMLHAGFQAERCLLHSGSTARDNNMKPSDICWADKYCVCLEPDWFYLFRTWLSGESKEFVQRAIDSKHIPAGSTNLQWHRWYQGNVLKRPEIHDLLSDNSPVREHYLRQYNPRALTKSKAHNEKTTRGLVTGGDAGGPS